MPELATCLVFTPAKPALFSLNPSAWLILELAEGRCDEALEAEYLARTAPSVPPPVARRQLQEGLAMLVGRGILAPADGPAAVEEPRA